MDPTIELFVPGPVAYVRRTGPYGGGNAETMQALKAWAPSNDLMKGSAVLFGIAWDDPAATPPKECRYDACIALPVGFAPTGDGIKTGELPGGKYAVFTLPHTAEAVAEAWGQVFSVLAAQGLAPDPQRPILERYPQALVAAHRCQLCVPVL